MITSEISYVLVTPGTPEGCPCDFIYMEQGPIDRRRYAWHLIGAHKECPVHGSDEWHTKDFHDFHAIERKGVLKALHAIWRELDLIDGGFAMMDRIHTGRGTYEINKDGSRS